MHWRNERKGSSVWTTFFVVVLIVTGLVIFGFALGIHVAKQL